MLVKFIDDLFSNLSDDVSSNLSDDVSSNLSRSVKEELIIFLFAKSYLPAHKLPAQMLNTKWSVEGI